LTTGFVLFVESGGLQKIGTKTRPLALSQMNTIVHALSTLRCQRQQIIGGECIMTFDEWYKSYNPKLDPLEDDCLEELKSVYEAGYFKGVEDEHKKQKQTRETPF